MSPVPGCPGASSAPQHDPRQRGEAEVPGFSTTSAKRRAGLGSSGLVLLKPLPKARSANAWLALPDQPKRGSEREGSTGGSGRGRGGGSVGRHRQREEEDRLLPVVSPWPQLAVPVLLQTDEPVLIGVLLGDVRVVMVLLDPLEEQALFAQ